jgi:hypothetical protein
MEQQQNDNGYSRLYHNLVNRVLKGEGYSSLPTRQAAFNNSTDQPPALRSLVENVAHNAHKITDSDIAAAKQTGVSEDQLFELIICAAVGQASRQYESGLSALAEALKEGGAHAS